MFSSSCSHPVAAVRARIVQFVFLMCAFAISPAHAAPGVAGSLDTTFAASSPLGAGKWRMSLATGNASELGTAVAVQPDGKLVIAGGCSQTGSIRNLCVFRLNADGTVDLGFGGNGTGLRINQTPGAAPSSNAVPVMVLQPDGKIVVAMNCILALRFCATRLNADGTTDTSFGVPSTSSGVLGWLFVQVGSGNYANAVALQPDGKILIAGRATGGDPDNDFAVLRVNTNGTLDTSFAASSPIPGTLRIPMGSGGSSDIGRGVIVQSDGKIVVTGDCGIDSDTDFCALRLNTDGSVDNSFGGNNDGKVFVQIVNSLSSQEEAHAVALQADGKFVLGGTCYGDPGNELSGFCALRLNTDGTLDTSFSGDGKLVEPVSGGLDIAYAMALQPDGKIVLAGTCRPSLNDEFCVLRLNADGSVDASFSGDGKLVQAIGTGSDRARAMALQPDGKFVVAGGCATLMFPEFCLMRLDADCTLDFDASNTNSASVDGAILVRSMLGFKDAALTSGISASSGAKRTVAQAASYRNYCKAAAAPLCNGDIDGDGKQTATIDALLAVRAMLGLTGSAAVGGINFPVGATRNTWSLIRNHLVDQCAMTLPP
jgi:uncharacterized delta-60 repeat protein